MTELEALNVVIGSIGISPVTSYESTHPAAVSARTVLERYNSTIQAQGWWFNREYALKLTPDTIDGRILIPGKALAIDPVDTSLRVGKRGRYLYNATEHTYVFSSSIEVDVVTEVDFPDVPVTIQNYIAKAAALDFATVEEGDQNKLTRLENEVFRARSEAMASELRHGDYNSKYSSTSLRVLAGIRPAVRRY
jgi:hypothetical protein